MGITPDDWQAGVLRSWADKQLLLCSRQSGKSLTSAAIAIWTAITQPPALVLLLSPTLRQSGELFKQHVLKMYRSLSVKVPIVRETALTLELENGSRIVSLPENEESIRGFSGVALLVIDEAARVSDSLYHSVTPMLAVSRGRLVALSTPFGKRGWFFEEWDHGIDWERTAIPATECPRISAEWLAREEAGMSARWFRQEYLLSFEDAVDAVFRNEDIMAAFCSTEEPLLID